MPVRCFGADVHTLKNADVHSNQFEVLTVEEGVDTHSVGEVPKCSVAADDDSLVNDCVVGCVRKGNEQS